MTLETVHRALKDKKTSLWECLEMLDSMVGRSCYESNPEFCKCGRADCPRLRKKKMDARCRHTDPLTVTEILNELDKLPEVFTRTVTKEQFLKDWRKKQKRNDPRTK